MLLKNLIAEAKIDFLDLLEMVTSSVMKIFLQNRILDTAIREEMIMGLRTLEGIQLSFLRLVVLLLDQVTISLVFRLQLMILWILVNQELFSDPIVLPLPLLAMDMLKKILRILRTMLKTFIMTVRAIYMIKTLLLPLLPLVPKKNGRVCKDSSRL